MLRRTTVSSVPIKHTNMMKWWYSYASSQHSWCKQYVFRFVCPPMLESNSLSDWQTCYCVYHLGNFTKFTILVQLATKMHRLDSEVKRSKVKVTIKPDMVKNHFGAIFSPQKIKWRQFE